MAHIRKRHRKDGTVRGYEARYRFRDPDGRLHTRAKTFRTRSQAEQFLLTKTAELEIGTHVDPHRSAITFENLAAGWQESSGWARLKPSTAARYKNVLKTHLLPRWGKQRLASITLAGVDKWCVELGRAGVSPASVVKVHGVFRAALSHALRHGYLRTNPAMGVELPRPPRREMVVLSSEELRLLADAVEPRYRPLVLTLGVCGLRFGELAGSKRKNVDILRGRITVAEALVNVEGQGLVWTTPKTHERRVVSVPAFLRPVLQDHLTTFTEGGSGPDDLAFTAPTGAPLRHNLLTRRSFRPAVKRVLPPERHKLRLHDLRHTAASLLIAAGAPVTLVAARLGHASPSTTLNVYAHMLPGADESTNAALEAAWETATTDP